jgi:hypothetical protein
MMGHDPLAAGYADRVLALRDGKLDAYEPGGRAAATAAGH